MSYIAKAKIVCLECGRMNEPAYREFESISGNTPPTPSRYPASIFCAYCNAQIEKPYDLIYIDKNRQFIVFLASNYIDTDEARLRLEKAIGVNAEMSASTCNFLKRIVKSENQLIEKIAIFERGLDDVIIEICKYTMTGCLEIAGMSPRPDEMLFAGLSDKGPFYDLALLNCKEASIPAPVILYWIVSRSELGKIARNERSLEIDSAWVERVIFSIVSKGKNGI